MVKTFEARNVNDAYQEVLFAFKAAKLEAEPSRNGPVARFPEPVILTYQQPQERVLFDAYRNANPFFHMMEGIWMLAGRNDLEFVAQFASNLRNYSDDGKVIHGAYGHRWREHFGHDQITEVVDQLLADPHTRRCVIANFDPLTDGYPYINGGGKDVPCNTHIYFAVRDMKLDMTVMARSNDMVWGALGANAVHMSMLHEVVAHGARYQMGVMHQFSNDYHIYLDKYKPEDLLRHMDRIQPYRTISPTPLVSWDYLRFLTECEMFCAHNWDDMTEPFLAHTAVPAYQAWQLYKYGEIGAAKEMALSIVGQDWKHACHEWLLRREHAKN